MRQRERAVSGGEDVKLVWRRTNKAKYGRLACTVVACRSALFVGKRKVLDITVVRENLEGMPTLSCSPRAPLKTSKGLYTTKSVIK